MATGYSPQIATDGLVFYYDTGNGKSYAGEPTTNLVDNANFSNGTTNWNGNQNVTLSVETINGTRLLKISSNQTTSTPGLKSANIPVTGNTTYTLTIRAYKNDSRTAHMYATGNGTGGADIVWSTSSLNGPNPITTELTTISRTFTTPSDMTYIQVGFLWALPLTTSEVYVEYIQLEQKPHATQFVNGTRSVTEGLKDLTKNSTIDLTNAGFDSNAQLNFDGTSDYASLGTVPLTAGASTYSIEAVFRADSIKTQVIWEQNSSGVIQHQRACLILLSGGTGGFNGQSNDFHFALPYSTGTWYHWVVTIDKNASSNPIKAYSNGVLVSEGDSNSGAANLNVGTHGAAVGYKLSSNGEYFDGEIKIVKVYNRALSAEEVQANYNAIKGRFGL